MSKSDERTLAILRYRRDQAEQIWNDKVKLIRENANQMNIRGLWQGAQLTDLVRLHEIFSVLDSAVQEAERECQPKSRRRRP